MEDGSEPVRVKRLMDAESEDIISRHNDFRSLAKYIVDCFERREYMQAAEAVSKVRTMFSENLTNATIDELADTGLVPELIDRIGVDMLATCPELVSESLQ